MRSDETDITGPGSAEARKQLPPSRQHTRPLAPLGQVQTFCSNNSHKHTKRLLTSLQLNGSSRQGGESYLNHTEKRGHVIFPIMGNILRVWSRYREGEAGGGRQRMSWPDPCPHSWWWAGPGLVISTQNLKLRVFVQI